MLETFARELARRFPGIGGRCLARLLVELLRLHARRQSRDRSDSRAPQSDRRDGHVGPLLQARAVARARGTAELVVDGCVRSFDWSVFAYGRFARRGDRARLRPRARMIGGVLLAAGAGSRFRAAGGDIKLLARGRRAAACRAGARGPRRRAARRPRDRARRARRRAAGGDRSARCARRCATSTGSAAWPRRCRSGWRRSIPACTARRRRARRRAGAGGRGHPPRGRGGRGRRRPRRGDLRRRAHGHPVAIPRALWARLPHDGRAGRTRARRAAPCSSTAATCRRRATPTRPPICLVAHVPACASATCGRRAARARHRRSRPAPSRPRRSAAAAGRCRPRRRCSRA